MMSEKKEAASITPAAKPSSRFSCFSLGRPMTRIGSAPTKVASPAARLPRNPMRMMF
jgi:hypothetical protein